MPPITPALYTIAVCIAVMANGPDAYSAVALVLVLVGLYLDAQARADI